jgi:hypothetical protein
MQFICDQIIDQNIVQIHLFLLLFYMYMSGVIYRLPLRKRLPLSLSLRLL